MCVVWLVQIVVLQNLMLRVKRTGDMCFQPVIDGELLADTVVNRSDQERHHALIDPWRMDGGRGLLD